MQLVLLAVCALVAVAFLMRINGAGSEANPSRPAGANMKSLLTLIALLPIGMLLISVWNVVTPFSFRVMMESFDNYRKPQSLPHAGSAPASQPATRIVDENDLRTEFFINGPRQFGWQTLPTEIEAVFPVDGQERYTGMNVSLLQGCKLDIHIPGNLDDKSFFVDYYTPRQARPIAINHDYQTVNVDSDDQLSGASFLRFTPKRKEVVPRMVTARLSVTSKPGHIRVAAWKAVMADRSGVLWGKVPDSEHFKWTLYVRFADEDGMPLTPSMMQDHPGALRIGKLQSTQGETSEMSDVVEKIVSQPECVYGEYIAKGKNCFLSIGTPDLTGRKVRVEVILDIVPR